jgi:hypothetical protein
MVSLVYCRYARVMLGQYIHPALHFIVCQLSQTCANMVASFTAPICSGSTFNHVTVLFLRQVSQMCPYRTPHILQICSASTFNHVDLLYLSQLSQMCPHGKPR